MKRFFLPSFILMAGSFAMAQTSNTDNIAGVPVAEKGINQKQNINLQAHLKASAKSTFGVDLDTNKTGFKNEAKASVVLDLIKLDDFTFNNGAGKTVNHPNKGIRGGIAVEDLYLRTGDGYALKGDDEIKAGKDLKNKLLLVSYGDIYAWLNIYDFYVKVSTNPDIKAGNSTRYWSAPVNGINSKYYGQAEGLFFGKESLTGRVFKNTIGGISLGYQIDNLFGIHSQIASMGSWDRNDDNNKVSVTGSDGKTTLQEGTPDFENAYAYKLAAELYSIPNLVVSLNGTGTFGSPEWLMNGVGRPNPKKNKHNVSAQVYDGRPGVLKLNGSNGAYTAGLGVDYTLPLSDLGLYEDHQLKVLAGVDYIFDPFASESSMFTDPQFPGKPAGSDQPTPVLPSPYSKDRGTNSAISAGLALGYRWPISEGKYVIKSGDTANRTFYHDDGNDRYSGITAGVNFTRALGFTRADNKEMSAQAKKAYENGVNSLSANVSVYEDEKGGLIPGLGFVMGLEINDIFKQGYLEIPTDKGTVPKEFKAMSVAVQTEISYALVADFLAPKGQIVPFVGVWYSPNSPQVAIPGHEANKWQNFVLNDKAPRFYTKLGVALEEVIPFSVLELRWDSNNLLASNNKFGAVTTSIKVLYE